MAEYLLSIMDTATEERADMLIIANSMSEAAMMASVNLHVEGS